jgi:hypothetical protein
MPVAASLSRHRAEELERQAIATGQPTPRAAAEVLIAATAADLRDLDAKRQAKWRELAKRIVRQNYVLDADGLGLPERHPDRIPQDTVAQLIVRDNAKGHIDPMQVNRWSARWLERHGDPPRYKLDDTDTAAGP